MFHLLATIPRVLFCEFQSRHQLLLENLALRHQLTVLQRSVPRAKLKSADRFLWVLLLRWWSGWQRVLVIVEPRTVVAWHRAGFRRFWRWKSRPDTGRPPVNRDLIGLIRRMWQTNPTWGQPAHPGGTGQTRHPGLRLHRPQVSSANPARRPSLEDLPPKPR